MPIHNISFYQSFMSVTPQTPDDRLIYVAEPIVLGPSTQLEVTAKYIDDDADLDDAVAA